MKISIELTFMPLQSDYEDHIKNFIKQLRDSNFTLLENPLSTQIYGDIDELLPFLQVQIRKSFIDLEAAVINLKLVKTDRSGYEPNF